VPRIHSNTFIAPRIRSAPATVIAGRAADPRRHWNGNWERHSDYGWHRNWHHGFWPSWGWVPGGWLAGTAGGWLFPGESIAYSNPYYTAPETLYQAAVPDYSAPIPFVTGGEELQADESASVSPPDTIQDFLAARAAFKRADYATALTLINRALVQETRDPVMHEFRALTLFALGMYRDAAAGIYAILSAGPGWDRDTMLGLYPNAETYTRQLRTLEQYQRDNPSSADASFLLAYHYLTLNQRDQAVRQLEQVVRLQPNNALPSELLRSLTTPPAAGQ